MVCIFCPIFTVVILIQINDCFLWHCYTATTTTPHTSNLNIENKNNITIQILLELRSSLDGWKFLRIKIKFINIKRSTKPTRVRLLAPDFRLKLVNGWLKLEATLPMEPQWSLTILIFAKYKWCYLDLIRSADIGTSPSPSHNATVVQLNSILGDIAQLSIL